MKFCLSVVPPLKNCRVMNVTPSKTVFSFDDYDSFDVDQSLPKLPIFPCRGKLNNSSENDICRGYFIYLCSQAGKRKNELSALNVNNKSGQEFLRENRGE